jgi:quercetin dioxygenase-like cupin family protein
MKMDSGTQDTGLERPVEPSLLIETQADAVVSRTVLKQPSGSVTLFAFDGGEGLSEHTTPHDALIYGLDGEAEITIGGAAHTVTSGRALHLPADVPHGVRALSPFKMMLVMLKRSES